MPYLFDARLQEIAQYLQTTVGSAGVLTVGGKTYAQFSYVEYAYKYASVAKQVGLASNIDLTEKSILGPLGTTISIAFESAKQLKDVAGLAQAVKSGVVTAIEATAYLNQKYPDQDWSGGSWGDQAPAVSSVAASDAAAAPADSEGYTPPEKVAQIAQAAAGSPAQAVNLSPAVSSLKVSMGELPDVWDPVQVQDELEQFSQKVGSALLDVQQGNIQYKGNSIPGAAISPGSLDATKLNPIAMREFLSESPGPALAVKIAHTRSPSIDRWIQGASHAGPGRVLRTNTVTYPFGLKPTPGPQRFRVLYPGMKFGIMSMVLAQDLSQPDFVVRYGVVLAKIPHLLNRIPQEIAAVWVGEAPVAMAVIQSPLGAFLGTPRLLHDNAIATYDDVDYPFLTAYEETGLPGASLLTPERDPDFGLCRCFDLSLITGRTAAEVYQQLNSRQAELGLSLGRSAHGPSASAPPTGHLGSTNNASTEEILSAPAPAAMANWNGAAGLPNMATLAEGGSFETENRVVHGIPFSYADCQRLIATKEHFSLVIQPRFSRYVATNVGEAWPSPDNWWRIGVQAVGSSGRDWAVDIIVQ